MIFPLSQGNTKETSAQKVTKITKRYLGRNVSAYRRIGVSAYRRVGGSAYAEYRFVELISLSNDDG